METANKFCYILPTKYITCLGIFSKYCHLRSSLLLSSSDIQQTMKTHKHLFRYIFADVKQRVMIWHTSINHIYTLLKVRSCLWRLAFCIKFQLINCCLWRWDKHVNSNTLIYMIINRFIIVNFITSMQLIIIWHSRKEKC